MKLGNGWTVEELGRNGFEPLVIEDPAYRAEIASLVTVKQMREALPELAEYAGAAVRICDRSYGRVIDSRTDGAA